MATVLADNAYGTLASGLAVGDTALSFTTGHGARFPTVTAPDVLYCCILNSANTLEEVIITAHTAGSDSATITRAAGATIAKVWNAGDRIEARISKSCLNAIIADIQAGNISGNAGTATTATTAGSAGIPQNSKSAAYTTVLSDANKQILHPASDNNPRTFTIDSNANVPYPIGTTLTFPNEINTLTIAITSDTLSWVGSGSTGSRTLAANGLATALKITATKWMISGTGLA